MTVAAERRIPQAARPAGVRDRVRRELPWVAPTVVAVLNAIAFVVVAPNVNDIWAAMARESAARHGVGLTYWFTWYGGGAAPGNYSVLTPSLSVLVGAGSLGAVATVAITPLCWLAMRGTSHPTAGVWVATFAAGLNLWSGRIPFALGSMATVLVVVFVQSRKQAFAALAAILTVLLSPVSGVFVAIGLAGLFLVRPEFRRICVVTAAAIGASLLGLAIVFGQPGVEPYSWVQLVQALCTLAPFLFALAPDYLRATVWLSLVAALALYAFPNGLGDNIQRLVWYVLPAAVVATSGRQLRAALLTVALALGFATKQTVGDVFNGAQVSASPSYYQSLIQELDTVRPRLLDYRLEVAQDGTHTAAYTLLDHAMLARGYEYQPDNEYNSVLTSPDLDATSYKIWLDNNAVGYVAIAATARKPSPEYRLVSQRRPGYLHPVWHDKSWTLYRVANPNPIVPVPAHVTSFSQKQLVVSVPCVCAFTVRVRYSRFLTATAPARPDPVRATLADDGSGPGGKPGWTVMTTPAPGTYTLSGSLTAPFSR